LACSFEMPTKSNTAATIANTKPRNPSTIMLRNTNTMAIILLAVCENCAIVL
jgi:hypothetical protein